MHNTAPYRVVQWTTGNVGKSSVAAIAANPTLELVGCYAWSKDKAGRDVGELAGITPLGVEATNDVDAVEMVAGEAMLAGFDGALTLVLVVAMMLLGVDWRLALTALLPFPFMGFFFWRISSHVHQASTDSLRRFSGLNDHVQETLSGVRTLRSTLASWSGVMVEPSANLTVTPWSALRMAVTRELRRMVTPARCRTSCMRARIRA